MSDVIRNCATESISWKEREKWQKTSLYNEHNTKLEKHGIKKNYEITGQIYTLNTQIILNEEQLHTFSPD